MSKITRTLSVSFAITVLTFVMVVLFFVLYVDAEQQVETAQETRYNSIRLADELRHSSESLTKMVRSYIVTGDPAFKQYYFDIIAIRDGIKPRPVDNNYYWDLAVYGEKIPLTTIGQTYPLLERINQAAFGADEYQLLVRAKQNSDKLTDIEKQAMALFEHNAIDATEDQTRAKNMLFDEAYNQAKLAIIRPISQFNELMEKRTAAALNHAKDRANHFRWGFIIADLLLLFLLWRVYRALLSFLGASPSILHDQIVRLGKGDFTHPNTPHSGDKDSITAWLCEARRKLQEMTVTQMVVEARLRAKTQSLEKSEARLQTLIEISPIPKAIITVDGQVTFINQAFTHYLGYSKEDFTTLDSWWPKAYPDPTYREWVKQLWQAGVINAKTDKQVLHPTEIQIQAKNGTFNSVVAEAIMIEDEVIGDFILVVFHDITDLRKTERDLLVTKERLEAAAAAGIVGIWDWDIVHNKLVWDEVMYRLYGVNAADFGGAYDAWNDAIHPEDKARVEMEIQAALRGEKSYAAEFRVVWPDGSIRHLKAMAQTIFDSAHQPLRMIGVNYDLTEQKNIQQQLDQLAFYDSLTQLPNRRLLEDRLNQAVALADRERQKVALLFIDLDKFKNVNDEKGHEAGDWLLKNVAMRIQHCLRASDTVARLGGDEFVVLLPNTQTIDEAVRVAEKIRSVLAQPFVWKENQVLDISSSIGIAVYPDDTDDACSLLRFGDKAMYMAKKEGRNMVMKLRS